MAFAQRAQAVPIATSFAALRGDDDEEPWPGSSSAASSAAAALRYSEELLLKLVNEIVPADGQWVPVSSVGEMFMKRDPTKQTFATRSGAKSLTAWLKDRPQFALLKHPDGNSSVARQIQAPPAAPAAPAADAQPASSSEAKPAAVEVAPVSATPPPAEPEQPQWSLAGAGRPTAHLPPGVVSVPPSAPAVPSVRAAPSIIPSSSPFTDAQLVAMMLSLVPPTGGKKKLANVGIELGRMIGGAFLERIGIAMKRWLAAHDDIFVVEPCVDQSVLIYRRSNAAAAAAPSSAFAQSAAPQVQVPYSDERMVEYVTSLLPASGALAQMGTIGSRCLSQTGHSFATLAGEPSLHWLRKHSDKFIVQIGAGKDVSIARRTPGVGVAPAVRPAVPLPGRYSDSDLVRVITESLPTDGSTELLLSSLGQVVARKTGSTFAALTGKPMVPWLHAHPEHFEVHGSGARIHVSRRLGAVLPANDEKRPIQSDEEPPELTAAVIAECRQFVPDASFHQQLSDASMWRTLLSFIPLDGSPIRLVDVESAYERVVLRPFKIATNGRNLHALLAEHPDLFTLVELPHEEMAHMAGDFTVQRRPEIVRHIAPPSQAVPARSSLAAGEDAFSGEGLIDTVKGLMPRIGVYQFTATLDDKFTAAYQRRLATCAGERIEDWFRRHPQHFHVAPEPDGRLKVSRLTEASPEAVRRPVARQAGVAAADILEMIRQVLVAPAYAATGVRLFHFGAAFYAVHRMAFKDISPEMGLSRFIMNQRGQGFFAVTDEDHPDGALVRLGAKPFPPPITPPAQFAEAMAAAARRNTMAITAVPAALVHAHAGAAASSSSSSAPSPALAAMITPLPSTGGLGAMPDESSARMSDLQLAEFIYRLLPADGSFVQAEGHTGGPFAETLGVSFLTYSGGKVKDLMRRHPSLFDTEPSVTSGGMHTLARRKPNARLSSPIRTQPGSVHVPRQEVAGLLFNLLPIDGSFVFLFTLGLAYLDTFGSSIFRHAQVSPLRFVSSAPNLFLVRQHPNSEHIVVSRATAQSASQHAATGSYGSGGVSSAAAAAAAHPQSRPPADVLAQQLLEAWRKILRDPRFEAGVHLKHCGNTFEKCHGRFWSELSFGASLSTFLRAHEKLRYFTFTLPDHHHGPLVTLGPVMEGPATMTGLVRKMG